MPPNGSRSSPTTTTSSPLPRAPLPRYDVAPAPGKHGVGEGQGPLTPPLAPRDAALQILAHLQRQPALRVPLDDALGAVLAETVISPLDLPPWANSAMDGYALRAADILGASEAAPRRLRVIEQIPAGQFPTRPIEPGTCARIFTGAPVPEGADSVVRQEDTDLGQDAVQLSSATAMRRPTSAGPARTSGRGDRAVGRAPNWARRSWGCSPRWPWRSR